MAERDRTGGAGERGTDDRVSEGAERTLGHDALADREYTTAERAAELDRESPSGLPASAPGEDPRRAAVERHAAPGAQGTDLDAARELASRDLDEEAAVRREDERDDAPSRRE